MVSRDAHDRATRLAGPSPQPGASPTPTPEPSTPSPTVDQDGDGYPSSVDCSDVNNTVHPGRARDPRQRHGRRLLRGGDQPGKVLAIVKSDWTVTRRTDPRVKLMQVRDAPAGAQVDVLCKGRGCPFKQRRKVLDANGEVSLTKLFKHFALLTSLSGCGKTTTLRMMGGFEEPCDGTILYLGDNDVTGLPPYRRDVNTVFQSYALFPHLNVFENVAFGLRRRGVGKGANDVAERGHRMLDLVQCLGMERRKPRQFPEANSSGWRSRGHSSTSPGAPSRRAARRTRLEASQGDAALHQGRFSRRSASRSST